MVMDKIPVFLIPILTAHISDMNSYHLDLRYKKRVFLASFLLFLKSSKQRLWVNITEP